MRLTKRVDAVVLLCLPVGPPGVRERALGSRLGGLGWQGTVPGEQGPHYAFPRPFVEALFSLLSQIGGSGGGLACGKPAGLANPLVGATAVAIIPGSSPVRRGHFGCFGRVVTPDPHHTVLPLGLHGAAVAWWARSQGSDNHAETALD